MLSFIVGVPGSGKTALAVDYLIDNGHKNKYDFIYNNINEFNNALIPNCSTLEWDSFYNDINELYVLYNHKIEDPITRKKIRISDDVLIDKAKELKLFNSLIIIDEAHNYFDKRDPILIWWLSYHRHLSQEIFLITQNLSLVESKYKSFAEVFYRAVPSLLRLFPNQLKYKLYSESRMSKISQYATKTINVKTNNIFKYYKSGHNTKSKPIILKMIIVSLISLVIIYYGLMFLFQPPKKSTKKSNETVTTISKSNPEVKPNIVPILNVPIKVYKNDEFIPYLDEDYLLLNFYCVGEVCYILDKTFPYSKLDSLINSTNSNLLFSVKKSNINFYDGYILASHLLQKIIGAVYEKDTDSSIIYPIGGS